MIEGWSVVALALGYVSILFAVAWYADRADRFSKSGSTAGWASSFAPNVGSAKPSIARSAALQPVLCSSPAR